MKAAKRLGIGLILALVFTAAPAALAAEAPAVSQNLGGQEYVNGRRWAAPVNSYLYENENGGLTRVEYIDGQVLVEDYDSTFRLQSSRRIQPELPVWGGFYAGEEYNFLIFGQNNLEENDSAEVIRVVKYGKDWTRLGAASLQGGNTIRPFNAGSLRCGEYGGWLYVRTCHQMYASERDGLNHQANLMMAVRQADMALTDSFYLVEFNVGYVSHSFNQFVLVDQEGRLVTLDHGDAYPRGALLQRYVQPAGQESFRYEEIIWTPDGHGGSTGSYADACQEAVILEFPTAVEYNDTGFAAGGLAETANGYVTAYQYDGTASSMGSDKRDVYLAFVGKDMTLKTPARLTTGVDASVPQLASAGLDGGYVLWNEGEYTTWYSGRASDTLCYASYDADGNVGPVQTAKGFLSDCAPVWFQGKAVWYVTNGGAPVFYTLDASGVTAWDTGAPAPDPTPDPGNAAGTAYASTQEIEVDGTKVVFEAYALKDGSGNDTNYVKLRDVASVLSGTAAQFQVGWDGAVVIDTGAAYTPNGTEMSTPFSGNRGYEEASAPTKVDGAAAALSAILLKDDAGNGYTYYKLRDLGEALGFQVDWSAERGIFIETGGSGAEANSDADAAAALSSAPDSEDGSDAAASSENLEVDFYAGPSWQSIDLDVPAETERIALRVCCETGSMDVLVSDGSSSTPIPGGQRYTLVSGSANPDHLYRIKRPSSGTFTLRVRGVNGYEAGGWYSWTAEG